MAARQERFLSEGSARSVLTGGGAVDGADEAGGADDSGVDGSDSIEGVLEDSSESGEKTRRLFRMLSRLEGPAHLEALQHAVNLVDEADFDLISQQWLREELSRDEAFVLLGDLLERPEEVMLPVLRAVAATPGHVLADVASDLLLPFDDPPAGLPESVALTPSRAN